MLPLGARLAGLSGAGLHCKEEKIKDGVLVLTGVAQWVRHCPAKQKVASLITIQGTVPRSWVLSPVKGRTMFLFLIDDSLPLILPPFPSLKKKKKKMEFLGG